MNYNKNINIKLQEIIAIILFIIYQIIFFYLIHNLHVNIKKIILIFLNILFIYKTLKNNFQYINRFYSKFRENNKPIIQYNIFTSIISFMIFLIYLIINILIINI